MHLHTVCYSAIDLSMHSVTSGELQIENQKAKKKSEAIVTKNKRKCSDADIDVSTIASQKKGKYQGTGKPREGPCVVICVFVSQLFSLSVFSLIRILYR